MAKEKTAGEYAEERATTEPDTESGRFSHEDPLDLGVKPEGRGDLAGPEDALAVGEERENTAGDYEDRIGPSNYHPHITVLNDDGEQVVIAQRTGEVVASAAEVEEE